MLTLFKSKGFLGLLILFVVGAFVYNTFFQNPSVVGGESALSVGQDLVKLSDQLSSAELSQDLFNLPGYLHLTDFSVPLSQEPLGRANPFDIIGR